MHLMKVTSAWGDFDQMLDVVLINMMSLEKNVAA